MNDKDGIDMQRSFEDSLDMYAKTEIEKYYNEEKMQEELKDRYGRIVAYIKEEYNKKVIYNN